MCFSLFAIQLEYFCKRCSKAFVCAQLFEKKKIKEKNYILSSWVGKLLWLLVKHKICHNIVTLKSL